VSERERGLLTCLGSEGDPVNPAQRRPSKKG